ncbi:hypothetical protein INS49_013642 [Diaporthe citri]|uniref:uncharacterized protein n=1 Tax=Diaporthe citri TaxID=83186 RepID=UPI001C7F9D91|nr:uncharacterized protein INS49_013642 [Diaporthe citri]KAG6357763.1 hypothetical protein INS49_013642 [Diaporthe citri]
MVTYYCNDEHYTTKARVRTQSRNRNHSAEKASERLHATVADLIPVIDVRQGQYEAAYRFIYGKTKHRVRRPNDQVPAVRLAEARRSFREIHLNASLGHQVILTLMAIRALRHVQDIMNLNVAFGQRGTNERGRALPQEIIDLVCEHLGSVFLENLFGFDLSKATSYASWRRSKIREMQWVVTKCVYDTARSNKHIWLQMLDTDRSAAPGKFGQFSTKEGWDVEKMAGVVAVRQYQVWMETPGSFDILRKAMAKAARWGSEQGYCWPIERQVELDYIEGMPVPHHYHT